MRTFEIHNYFTRYQIPLFLETNYLIQLCKIKKIDARNVTVIFVGNLHGDPELKSWTKLIALHIALISLGNV